MSQKSVNAANAVNQNSEQDQSEDLSYGRQKQMPSQGGFILTMDGKVLIDFADGIQPKLPPLTGKKQKSEEQKQQVITDVNEVRTIGGLKRQVYIGFQYPVTQQVIQFEGVILQNDTDILQLLGPLSNPGFSSGHNSKPSQTKSKNEQQVNSVVSPSTVSIDDEALGRVVKLELKLASGLCNLKVNVISEQLVDSNNVTVLVHSSISLALLNTEVQKVFAEKIPSNAHLLFFLRKKQLPKNSFLFEHLTDVLSLKTNRDSQDQSKQPMGISSDRKKNSHGKNVRELSNLFIKFQKVDEYLSEYSAVQKSHRSFQLQAYLQFQSLEQPERPLSLCIDFKFNRLRDVKRVEWKGESPWYCEVQDGFSWFGYCLNDECVVYRSLFVVNRGYGIFKLENEINDLSCPVCYSKKYELRNIGFVNCEWALKGALKNNTVSRVIVDGQTFDSKLYTFQELDYKRQLDYLNIFVKKNSENQISNICFEKGSENANANPNDNVIVEEDLLSSLSSSQYSNIGKKKKSKISNSNSKNKNIDKSQDDANSNWGSSQKSNISNKDNDLIKDDDSDEDDSSDSSNDNDQIKNELASKANYMANNNFQSLHAKVPQQAFSISSADLPLRQHRNNKSSKKKKKSQAKESDSGSQQKQQKNYNFDQKNNLNCLESNRQQQQPHKIEMDHGTTGASLLGSLWCCQPVNSIQTRQDNGMQQSQQLNSHQKDTCILF